MHWIKTILGELYGLFVDDGAFALAIIIWLAAAGALLPRAHLESAENGVILFAGLAAILVESALRRARK